MQKYTAILILGVIAGLMSMALYFLIEYVWGEELDEAQISLILGLGVLAGSVIVLGLAIQYFDRRTKSRLRPEVEEEIRSDLEKELRQEIEAQKDAEFESMTGIVRIFPNFSDCEEEVLDQIKSSKTVRIFLQIGKKVFGGVTNFYDDLEEITLNEGVIVKIFHASKESPYLSKQRAKEIKSNHDLWMVDLDTAEGRLDPLIKKSKTKVSRRQHKEGYLWRLFIFDDYAYIQPYLIKPNNHDFAPVLKLSRNFSSEAKKENHRSLYTVFSNYFDYKWREYLPSEGDLPRND